MCLLSVAYPSEERMINNKLQTYIQQTSTNDFDLQCPLKLINNCEAADMQTL